uniref:Uncharacterized protein n=1 Tax=Cacopsylla melanoneura TaxID=428564 RepID=A0A8D8ZD50_9HEMI
MGGQLKHVATGGLTQANIYHPLENLHYLFLVQFSNFPFQIKGGTPVITSLHSCFDRFYSRADRFVLVQWFCCWLNREICPYWCSYFQPKLKPVRTPIGPKVYYTFLCRVDGDLFLHYIFVPPRS